MKDLQTRVLRTLRNPKLVNGIGLTLVALVGLWLVVNFIKGPQEFVNVALDGLQKGPLQGKAIDPYAIYGGQAAQVMLDAIAASDGSRADVIKKLFETNVTDGLLGSFKIDENGDPEEASGAVVGFTIYVATDELTTETVISPDPATVTAAGGG